MAAVNEDKPASANRCLIRKLSPEKSFKTLRDEIWDELGEIAEKQERLERLAGLIESFKRAGFQGMEKDSLIEWEKEKASLEAQKPERDKRGRELRKQWNELAA